MKKYSFLVPLGCLNKPVDESFKSLNAAGLLDFFAKDTGQSFKRCDFMHVSSASSQCLSLTTNNRGPFEYLLIFAKLVFDEGLSYPG